jgi:hypothetical protein
MIFAKNLRNAHLESLHFQRSSKELWRLDNVAAFCACCGTEITLKAETCPVCGTPRHGMSQPDLLLTLDGSAEPSQKDIRIPPKPSKWITRKVNQLLSRSKLLI